jgi:glucokinase
MTIGLDLGGTDLKAGRVGADGALAGFTRRPSRAAESERAPIEIIVEAARELFGTVKGPLPAIGVGVPGAIDPSTGSLVGRTPHLPHWENAPLAAWLSEALGTMVTVENDANTHAFAEHRLGAARGARVSITVTLGTGVGGGIVVGDTLVRGAFGGAGELGHVALGSGEWPCACGVDHCAEPEMSASGLVRAGKAAGLAVASGADVFALAAVGDQRAIALIDRLGDRLGAAISAAVGLVNPDIVVIGGGLAQAGEPLLTRLRAAVERYALSSHRRGLRIVPAALGEQAGVIGAGLLAEAAAEGADRQPRR